MVKPDIIVGGIEALGSVAGEVGAVGRIRVARLLLRSGDALCSAPRCNQSCIDN